MTKQIPRPSGIIETKDTVPDAIKVNGMDTNEESTTQGDTGFGEAKSKRTVPFSERISYFLEMHGFATTIVSIIATCVFLAIYGVIIQSNTERAIGQNQDINKNISAIKDRQISSTAQIEETRTDIRELNENIKRIGVNGTESDIKEIRGDIQELHEDVKMLDRTIRDTNSIVSEVRTLQINSIQNKK